MEPALIGIALAGAAIGFIAGALPGFHVNTLSLALLSSAPEAGRAGALFLVAALAASPFGLLFTGTFLGGVSDDNALQSLPAHRLAREGRGIEAVALQSWGAFAGLLLALPLAALARPGLTWLSPRLGDAVPWLLGGILLLLVWTETRRLPVHRRRVIVPWQGHDAQRIAGVLTRDGRKLRIGRKRVLDPHGLLNHTADQEHVDVAYEPRWQEGAMSRWAGRGVAIFVLALSGALGLAALPMGASSPFGLPASVLLPLLGGLFAAPSLLATARIQGRVPLARLDAPRPPPGELLRGALPGAAASSLLGIVPGVSPSHAALLVPRGGAPERALVTLAAVNGGAVVFTLLAWHTLAKARSGALVAAQALALPDAWRHAPVPPGVVDEALVIILAAGLACAAARLLASPFSRALQRPARWARGGLMLLVLSVTLFNGAFGLAQLAVATLVGLVPLRLGVRRSHAMGVILVPALVRTAHWGLT